MENTVNLIYKINGPGVEDGIDVFELSPILLSYGKMIKEAYETLYPDNPEIAINVKPFQKGSFLIDIVMHAKQWFDWTKTTQAQDLLNAITWLGIYGTGTTTLISVIKFLKGKVKSIEKLQSGDFVYHGDDNVTINVNQQINSLYQNCTIQQHIYNSIARPLEADGVETIESYLKDQEEEKAVYNKEIIKPIKEYVASSLPNDKESTTENLSKVWLHPKRISLEGEKGHWSFRMGDAIITATISDESFLNKVKVNDIRFANSDNMLVELITKQQIKGKEVSTTFEVVKVLDYQEGAKQRKIEFNEDE